MYSPTWPLHSHPHPTSCTWDIWRETGMYLASSFLLLGFFVPFFFLHNIGFWLIASYAKFLRPKLPKVNKTYLPNLPTKKKTHSLTGVNPLPPSFCHPAAFAPLFFFHLIYLTGIDACVLRVWSSTCKESNHPSSPPLPRSPLLVLRCQFREPRTTEYCGFLWDSRAAAYSHRHIR